MRSQRFFTCTFENLSDSQIGKANKDIFKRDIEIAKKESGRIREYERKDL